MNYQRFKSKRGLTGRILATDCRDPGYNIVLALDNGAAEVLYGATKDGVFGGSDQIDKLTTRYTFWQNIVMVGLVPTIYAYDTQLAAANAAYGDSAVIARAVPFIYDLETKWEPIK